MSSDAPPPRTVPRPAPPAPPSDAIAHLAHRLEVVAHDLAVAERFSRAIMSPVTWRGAGRAELDDRLARLDRATAHLAGEVQAAADRVRHA